MPPLCLVFHCFSCERWWADMNPCKQCSTMIDNCSVLIKTINKMPSPHWKCLVTLSHFKNILKQYYNWGFKLLSYSGCLSAKIFTEGRTVSIFAKSNLFLSNIAYTSVSAFNFSSIHPLVWEQSKICVLYLIVPSNMFHRNIIVLHSQPKYRH